MLPYLISIYSFMFFLFVRIQKKYNLCCMLEILKCLEILQHHQYFTDQFQISCLLLQNHEPKKHSMFFVVVVVPLWAQLLANDLCTLLLNVLEMLLSMGGCLFYHWLDSRLLCFAESIYFILYSANFCFRYWLCLIHLICL